MAGNINIPDRKSEEFVFPVSDDFTVTLRTEIPLFTGGGKQAKRINRFYAKKLRRTAAYYRKTSKKAGRRPLYPRKIVMTYELSDMTAEHTSILRKITFESEAAVTDRYFSENWSSTGDIMFLEDLLPSAAARKRRIADAIYEKCSSFHTVKFSKKLKRDIIRYFSPENFYFKEGSIYIFYQPGQIADEKHGLISVPFDFNSIMPTQKCDKKQKKAAERN